MGAVPVPGPRADLVPVVVDDLSGLEVDGGLPAGVLPWAGSVAAALAAVGGWLTSTPLSASTTGVAVTVRMPEVMAASYSSSRAMVPADPRPFGSGFLHADVGAPGDAQQLESCLNSLPAGASAHAAAEEAQAWRLAVCDYRARVGAVAISPLAYGPALSPVDRDFTVVDMTSMWAGPLAVWLLSLLGAKVTRVEPTFRSDGFRALDGGGIYPDGISCDAGRDSGMFNAFHPCPDRGVDLDLRRPADRSAFEELAGGSDLVVESFSARVMGNLGYESVPGGATRASVTAFGAGRQSHWVAYGTGVHAASGLGDVGGGRYSPGAVSYPDPLGGLVLALGAAAAMAGRRLGAGVSRVSTSLASAVQPLLSIPPAPWPPTGAAGPELLVRADELGLMESRVVCGSPRRHPRTIFMSNQNVF